MEEGRDCDSEEKGKKKRVRTKRRCLIIIRGTSRRWIRIDNSKRVITCPIQNRCQREKCGWDTGVDVIENKRGWSKSRWRGNGYADSTTEYRRAFTASRKIFRAGLSEHFLAEACAGVARSIDRGYVLLQTGTRVLERKLMRESELIGSGGCEIVQEIIRLGESEDFSKYRKDFLSKYRNVIFY